MKSRLLAMLWVGTAVCAGVLGCSSDAQDGAAGSGGGAAGISGSGNVSSGGGGASGGLGASGAPTASACLENPTPLLTQGTLVSLPLQLVMGGKPFVFGQSNALADGGSLVPLNVRFYISEVKLLRGAGEARVPVDVVTAAGAPAPYGVHFFNAEELGSGVLRLLAPPGEYSGLQFALGIKLACNQQRPSSLTDPLTDTSQMTWPHAGGFLFLRYEGRYTAGAAGASSSAEIPAAVHMGGNIVDELVPHVTVVGELSVPDNGRLEKGLSVVMDELFEGATSDIDVSGMPGLAPTADVVAGERLRRLLPNLNAFVLEP